MTTRFAAVTEKLRTLERRTRPVAPDVADSLARRWAELPDHVRNPAQLMGQKLTGCEGTHGVFPSCDFACKPCYHSADANKVRVDGRHTIEQVDAQMSFLRAARGPGVHAQLIGGEATLLDPEDHAEALEVMRRHERFPMSFSHGDFDYDYLERLAVRPDGRRRFDVLAFAIHIDTTMHGRRGAPHPETEAELDVFRQRTVDMFERLRREHGVRHHLAHNMTVTPANLDQIAGVVQRGRRMGFRVFSFQPAAHVGNERRWDDDYRALTDDAVWHEVERGVGRSLPFRAMQMGDLRCNRATWGLWTDDRYTPVFEDDDPHDLAARDALYRALPGNFLFASRASMGARMARIVLANRRDLSTAAAWARRLIRRGGGAKAFLHGVHPTTYVMHSFIDAADVGPAWEALQRGERLEAPSLRAAQERLEACVYAMGHPGSGQIVPACVQHSVLDPEENAELAVLLPRRGARTPRPTRGGPRIPVSAG